MRYVFLNPKVKEEVTADPELFLVYRTTFSGYDEDIDPLHNPDWVARTQRLEEQKLEDAKRRLGLFKKELQGKNPCVKLIPFSSTESQS